MIARPGRPAAARRAWWRPLTGLVGREDSPPDARGGRPNLLGREAAFRLGFASGAPGVVTNRSLGNKLTEHFGGEGPPVPRQEPSVASRAEIALSMSRNASEARDPVEDGPLPGVGRREGADHP